MTTKLVFRVLGADLTLLGWAQALGHIRGDGNITTDTPTPIRITTNGEACYLSTHWCDVNVETRIPLTYGAVVDGATITVPPGVVIRVGDMPHDLPPVTVGDPIEVTVPVGALGARIN